MREVKDPIKRAVYLWNQACDSQDDKWSRVWTVYLMDTLMHYKINPQDLGIDPIELEALLCDVGLPTFDRFQMYEEMLSQDP